MKVVFATPTMTRPTAPYLDALEKSLPLVHAAGWTEEAVFEVGCPYISHARDTMTRKALDAGADFIVYIDHDLSWDPADLVTLLDTDGDVVAGTYRYKKDEEDYMGALQTADYPVVRADGAIQAYRVPAGFLKISRHAIRLIMKAHPELVYGEPERPSIDLFQHGAHQGVWYGEDMAFCRRWIDMGQKIWLVPNLNLNHHSGDNVFLGNYHNYLMRQPGGAKDPAKET